MDLEFGVVEYTAKYVDLEFGVLEYTAKYVDLEFGVLEYMAKYVDLGFGVSIPRVWHDGGGLRWGPPYDGQKSVLEELQETRFDE